MNRLLPFLFLLFPAIVFAQYEGAPVDIHVNGNVDFASNSLSYSAVNKYFQGGKISKAEKDKWSSRIREKNKAFVDASAGISVLWQLGNNEKTYKIGVSYQARFFAETRFTKNFWNTLLYGNKQYGTEKVILGDNSAIYTAYRDLKLDFVSPEWKLDERTTMCFGIGSGFRIGIAQLGFVSRELTLHNNTELSESIDIQADFDLKNAGSQYLNGLGGAFDISVSFDGEFAKDNKWSLDIFTKNLGFTYWNSKSYSLSRKLDFTFDGLEVNIAQFSNSVKGSIDSMVRYVTDSARRGTFATATPASLHACASLSFRNYYPVIIGVSGELSCTVFSNFILMASIAPSVTKEWKTDNCVQQFMFKLPIRYCNYSGFGLGGEVAYVHDLQDDMAFGLSLEGGVHGFTSAAAYGALNLRFIIR